MFSRKGISTASRLEGTLVDRYCSSSACLSYWLRISLVSIQSHCATRVEYHFPLLGHINKPEEARSQTKEDKPNNIIEDVSIDGSGPLGCLVMRVRISPSFTENAKNRQ